MTTVEPIRRRRDIKRIEKYLKKTSERDFMLFIFGINSGLRISDILKLNVEDVRDKQYIEICEKKTGKFKKFPLNDKLKHLIKIYTKGKSSEEPLFKTFFGNRMDRIEAWRRIKNHCKYLKLNINVGTHTLRKTFGYHHYKKFKDVAMLQKIFNHSNPAITLSYIGIAQEEIDNNYINFVL